MMWYTTTLRFGIILHLNCYLSQEVQGICKLLLISYDWKQFQTLQLKFEMFWKIFFSLASYGLSFQEDGYMNDNSVNVWAKTKIDFPELTTFTICTWVKFTYEVIIFDWYFSCWLVTVERFQACGGGLFTFHVEFFSVWTSQRRIQNTEKIKTW